MWYTILIMLLVDVGGLIVVYALLRDRLRRATTAEAQIADIREEVSSLLVELNQTTDRNIVLMEDRIGSLNDLLSAADKKIGLLHREIEKHDVGAKIYSRLAETRPAAGGPPAPHGSPAAAGGPPAPHGSPAPRAAASRGESVEGAKRPSVGAPRAEHPLVVELSERAEEAASSRTDERSAAGEVDVRQRVMMLYRSGFSASLIAGRVGAPLGEVELIISLEQRKGKA